MNTQRPKFISCFTSSAGFSLAEMLVVVAILGILLTAAIPLFMNAINNQRIKDCAANVKIINSAINRTAAITGKNKVDIDSATPAVKTILNRFLPGDGLDGLTCSVGGGMQAYSVVDGAIVGHTH